MTFRKFNKKIDGSDIWEGDVYERKEEAEFLTSILSNCKDGFVMNIDASWGSGKTFFLERWKKSIEDIYPCLYFNAWESDYSDEPLAVFLADANDQLKLLTSKKNEKVKSFLSKGIRVLAKSAPIITKSALKKAFGDEGVDGVKDVFDSEFEKTLFDISENVVKEQIKNYQERKKSIKEFKESIEDLIDFFKVENIKQPPLFIFVDELDRCRPDFSIKFLEQVKHILTTGNVVFVVATDTRQLESSIGSIYGEKFDSTTYLRRFFDQTYRLKKLNIHKFVEALFKSSPFTKNNAELFSYKSNCQDSFIWISHLFDLTPRDIEQLFSKLYAALVANKKIRIIHIDYLLMILVAQIRVSSDYYNTYVLGKVLPEELWENLRTYIKFDHGLDTYLTAMSYYFNSANNNSVTITEKCRALDNAYSSNNGKRNENDKYGFYILTKIMEDFDSYFKQKEIAELSNNIS